MGFAIADLFMGHNTPDYAAQAQAAEDKRQAAINTGTADINKAFAGFTPQFYNKRANAYIDYAMPQLADQYRQTSNQVGFGLANKGLSESSTAQKQWSDLFRANTSAKQGIADSAIGQSNQLQQSVANSKAQLLGQLYQTADPASANASAVSTAASFQTPSVFTPLANQFSNIVNQYYLSSLLNQRPATASPVSTNTGGTYFAPLPNN